MSVPVNLFPATRVEKAPLRMLSKDGVPLNRRYYSQSSGRDLNDDQMTRGYEIEEGRYVLVSDEELDKLAPKKSRDIDLRRFVDSKSIPPIYFNRAYFLTPADDETKAYRLLAKTMEDSDRAGIGTFVMRGKEYLVAIFAENGILTAQTMRFADELRSPKDVGLPEEKNVDKAAVTRFEKLIGKHAKSGLAERELKDEQVESLLKLVKSKKSHKRDIIETDEEEHSESNVVDIMEVLKKSMAAKKRAAS